MQKKKTVRVLGWLLLLFTPALMFGQDLKISQLPSGNPAQPGDLIPIARGSANFFLTPASLFNFYLTGNNTWSGAQVFVSDVTTFQPTTTPSVLGPVRFNDASGINRWAMGNRDCGGTVSNDFVLCGTSSDAFGQNQALRISAVTGMLTTPSIQGKRISGCATAASLNATCDTTVTWTTAFPDTNYTATCSGDVVTSGIPSIQGIDISAAKTASAITVRTISITAAAAQFTTIDCKAVHD